MYPPLMYVVTCIHQIAITDSDVPQAGSAGSAVSTSHDHVSPSIPDSFLKKLGLNADREEKEKETDKDDDRDDDNRYLIVYIRV